MSGICGIVNFDGKPVDPELLRKMAEAAAYRGPDGINYWIQGNVGFAHLALHTTPESVREHQPLVNRRGDIVLAADARVDNRDELIRTLTSKGYLEEKDPTDADLIMAAYECWDGKCATHIIGDFAFAIWDSRARKLVCSRDVIGIRPLFFCQQGQTLYIASAIASILGALDERPPLNEPLLVDFLCWNFERWVYQTIYDTIFRVPASHTLMSHEGQITFDRHWTLGAQPGPGYKRDEEYIDHFRNLFEEAIRCRLRSVGPVGISVSGGLDSSSIACMAHHMVERGDPQLPEVRLYSCVFDERYPAADEREYLQSVLDKCSCFPFTAVPGETLWGLKEMSTNGGLALDEPEIFPIRCMLTEVLRAAQVDDCRAVLVGEGADQILSSGAYANPDFLLDVRLMNLASEFRHFRQYGVRTMVAKLLQRVLVAPLICTIPETLLLWYQRLCQMRHAPKWVDKHQIRPVSSQELGPTSDAVTPSLSRAGSLAYRHLSDGWYVALLAYEASLASQLGTVYRYPFLDRQLVDYLLTIPAHLRFGNRQTKVILRRGMNNILVGRVQQRSHRTHFSEVTDSGYRVQSRDQVAHLLNCISKSGSPLIRAEALTAAWENHYRGSTLPSRVLVAPLLVQDWSNECSSD